MRTLMLCVPALVWAALASGGEVSFSAKPNAVKDGDKVKISFTVSAPTDVEVAVLGADGKVVRSLAAGVLGGAKPPPEPLKPGLAQELVWDGKGDWGAKAEGGPFKVRVRAGMAVKFGRTVGDSPYNFYEMFCGGMAVDQKNGDLYYLAKRGRDAHLFCLRVFDRTGKYLREIMPYPATLDAKSREAFGSLAVPGVEPAPPLNRMSIWPVFYPVVSKGGGEGVKLMGLHPTEPDTLVLTDEYFSAVWRVRRTDGGAGAPFEEALWEAGQAPGGYGRVGPLMGAIAPDGKAMYFTGYCSTAPKGQKLNPKWPEGRIYKMEPGKAKAARFADVELPENWKPAEEPWATPANGFQALHGIAVDKDGQVLVCDAAAGRVRVFSPDGKETGAIDAPGAYVLASDPKGGALYVLTRARFRDRKLGADAVVKYESSKPGAKAVATLQLTRGGTWLAGDFSGAAPQLWVADAPAPYTPEIARGNLLRIEEKNGKLELAEDLAERGSAAAGFAMRIDVDPEADLVCVNNGWSETRRYSGLTGEHAGKLAKNGHPETILGSELCVRRDGMVYVSGGGGYSGPWERFNRDLSPAPLADGKKQFADRYGKMGGGYFGNQGSCVAPGGHLYFNGMFSFRINAIFELNPDGSAGRCPRLQDAFAEGAAAKEDNARKMYVKHGLKGALIGSIQDQSGGLEVDQRGNLYVGLCLEVQGHEPPPELAKVRGIGAVVKFGPDGGAMLPDPDKVKPGAKYECYKNPPLTMPEKVGPGLVAVTRDGWAGGGGGKKLLEGALDAYPLLAPFSYEGCACQTPRFEVDDYGRLCIPNAYTCSVRVVDNAGNEILRFGSYGNFDDGLRAETAAGQKTDPAAPPARIPLAYPVAAKASFKHIYVADSANRRVVRVDPVWKAEETCEVK